MSRSLMQAVVEIRPDLGEFRRETERTSQRAARDAGDNLEDGIERGGKEGARQAGRHIEKEVGRASEKAASDFTSKMKRASANMAKAGGVMTAAVTAPLAMLGKNSVMAFSDLNEAIAFSGTVFEQQMPDIQAWAEGGARAFGMSTRQALEAASTFAIFGKNAGKTGAEVAEFSKEMTVLAADMASARNTSPDDAIMAIGAALRGEMEPLRRYGIMLDDAVLKQEAMNLGIYDGEGALTQQQKVLAAHGLIVQGAFDNGFVGDFARTSDDLAGSLKVTAAVAENTSASFGESLAPVVDKLADTLGDLMEKLSGLSPRTKKLIAIFAAVVAVVGPLLLLFGALAASISAISAALPIIAGLFGAISLPVLAVVAAVAAVIAILWIFRDDVADIARAVGRFFKNLGETIYGAMTTAVDAVVGVFWGMIDGIKAAINAVIGAVETAVNFLADGINTNVIGTINWLTPGGDPIPEIPELNLPRLAKGGTVYPSGRVVHLAEGGEPEDVVPHSKRKQYAEAVGGGTNYVTQNITVQGGNFDEKKLAKELDRIARQSAAVAGRPRRLAR